MTKVSRILDFHISQSEETSRISCSNIQFLALALTLAITFDLALGFLESKNPRNLNCRFLTLSPSTLDLRNEEFEKGKFSCFPSHGHSISSAPLPEFLETQETKSRRNEEKLSSHVSSKVSFPRSLTSPSICSSAVLLS